MDIDKYIKELPAEMQEKAQACETADDLVALFRDAGVPLPDGMIADLAGGEGERARLIRATVYTCPKCGSHNIVHVQFSAVAYNAKCLDCGHVWPDPEYDPS